MSNVFSTNKVDCPIKAYDCVIDETSTNCESILTGPDAAVTVNRDGSGSGSVGDFTFMARNNSIPANLPGPYPIEFSATAGTGNDVTKKFTYTVTLRCMIEPS